MSQAPIGIIDSGFGGLSVWKEVQALLPDEQLIYFADSGYCPYGTRPEEEVFNLTHRIISFFRERGCKMVVLACNTATAVAILRLRKLYPDLPFVGMEPALKPASEATLTGVIGILATENTFKGQHFNRTKEAFAKDKEVLVQPGYGLVELVERGLLEGDLAREKIAPLILPMMEKGIDQLVLGCSHYPFLSKEIKALMGEKITLIDPSPAIAKQVERLLKQEHLLSKVPVKLPYHFYSTGNLFALKEFIENNLLAMNPYPKILEKSWI